MKAILEQFTPDVTAGLLCRSVTEPYFSTPYHFHPEIELLYVSAGRGTLYVDEAFTEFGPGTLALIGSGVPHWWCSNRSYYATDCPERCTAHYVQIHHCLLRFAGVATPATAALHDLLRRAGRGLRFDANTAARVGPALIELAGTEGLHRLATLLQLLAELVDAPASPVSARPAGSAPTPPATDRLGLIYALVARRYAEPLPLEEVAAAVHLAPTSLCRFFRRRTGGSFTTFLNTYRVRKACELLRGPGEEGIARIAFRVGYNNLSHFNRQFRRVHGCSPRAYRKRYQQLPVA